MPSLWMLFASFAFALMGACVKLASEQYSIADIVFYRGLAGAALLYLLARVTRRSLATNEPAAHLWRGLVGVASLWLWFMAIARLPLASAVTLNYMSPIWTALACWRGRPVPWPLAGAILVSFAGVVLVLRPAFAAEQWAGGLMALARAWRLGRTLVVANLQYSGIVFSSVLGALVWGDALDASVWAGTAIILASCMLASRQHMRDAAASAPAPAAVSADIVSTNRIPSP